MNFAACILRDHHIVIFRPNREKMEGIPYELKVNIYEKIKITNILLRNVAIKENRKENRNRKISTLKKWDIEICWNTRKTKKKYVLFTLHPINFPSFAFLLLFCTTTILLFSLHIANVCASIHRICVTRHMFHVKQSELNGFSGKKNGISPFSFIFPPSIETRYLTRTNTYTLTNQCRRNIGEWYTFKSIGRMMCLIFKIVVVVDFPL